MTEAIGLAALAALIVYSLLIVPTMWVKIERPRLSLGLGKRIVQISDLHVEKLLVSPERLARLIESQQPDYIMLTGDYTSKAKYLGRLEQYLEAIASLGVPVYAVPGNHDYKLKSRTALLFKLLRQYNIRLLRNDSVLLDGFYLVGIDNYCTGHSRVSAAFRKIAAASGSSGSKTVVITHDPNVVPHIRKSFDYLMAGHLHGKQFNIPFFFKLVNKGALPSRGIYKGLHQFPQGAVYISKGIGQAGPNARFLVRSEITVHNL